MSGGNAEIIKDGRRVVMFATIGLAVAILAGAIVAIVFSATEEVFKERRNMWKIIKKTSLVLASFLLMAIGAAGFLGTNNVLAAPCDKNKIDSMECKACEGAREADPSISCYSNSKDINSVWSFARDIINWFLIAIGLISVFFIIWSGIRYATSGGDTERVKKAKHTMMYAIIGLSIALLSAVIINVLFDVTSKL
jgi:threonine/homoserine/homoserine lactone efflux protein